MPENYIESAPISQMSRAVYSYDKNNRLLTTTDPEGHVTSQTYDKLGIIAAKKDGKENTTTYTYDNNKNLITMTDKTGMTIRFYDKLGRVTTKTVANVGSINYKYIYL